MSQGLNVILLDRPLLGSDGYHTSGLVALRAQLRVLTSVVDNPFYVDEHRLLFDRLHIPVEAVGKVHHLHFTVDTRRDFYLLHVLLHEFGHHHDRMTTRNKRRASRGERFAEAYTLVNADRIWERYFNEFSSDR